MANQYQQFPNLDAVFVNPDDTLSIPWYHFLVNIWRRTGGANTPVNAVTLTSATPGSPAQVQKLSGSPFVFKATLMGTLIVGRKYTIAPATGIRTLESGGDTTEFSRDGGVNWFLVGIGPRAVPVLAGDQVRVSWFTPNAPLVTFFPIELNP